MKKSNISISAKASIAYTLANLISKGVSIITVPIFTRLMSSSEIGVGTTYSAWYSIIYAITSLSLCSGSINIAMLEFKNERDNYESSCLTLSTISSFLFIILIYFFRNYITNIFGLDKSIVYIMMITLLFNPALDFWYARQRYEYKYMKSVIVSISITVLTAIFSLLNVIYFKNKSNLNLGNVRVVSQSLILILFSFIAYIFIMKKGNKHFDFKIWKYALTISLPLIIHTISKSILDLSDRLMIDSLCGKSEAGIYGTVYSLSMLSLIVWNAINTAIIPVTFENLENRELKKINKNSQIILLIFGVTAILTTLFAPEILKIFTTETYYSAVYLVPALSGGIYFTAVYNIYGNFLLYKKKTSYIMFGTIIAATINIILNYFLINLYGYVAAAYTTLLSFIILAIMQCVMCRKVYGFRIVDDKTLFLLSIFVALISLSCNLLYGHNVVRYLLIIVIFIFLIKNVNRIICFFKETKISKDN